jgi:hypothetical protein
MLPSSKELTRIPKELTTLASHIELAMQSPVFDPRSGRRRGLWSIHYLCSSECQSRGIHYSMGRPMGCNLVEISRPEVSSQWGVLKSSYANALSLSLSPVVPYV